MRPSPKHLTSSSRFGTGPSTVGLSLWVDVSDDADGAEPSTILSMVEALVIQTTVAVVGQQVDKGISYRVLS